MGPGHRAAADRDPLLGRERELDLLVELLADARRGAGRHALVEGDAGIGKSRLLRELELIAARNRVRTLTVRGDPLATEVAFGLLLELVEPLLAGEPAERERLLTGAAALVLPLLEPAAGAERDDAAQHYAHGAYRLLANAAAAHGPLLVLVDDVQWADRGSLHVLAHLAARLRGEPIAVVAARRRGESPVDAAALERFQLEPAATVVELGPLQERELTALAAVVGLDDAPERFLHACAQASGGNPLLMTALLRDAATRADGGPLPATAEELAGVATVARWVEAQLTRRPPLVGELARMAAVLGDGASLRQAARLAGVDLDRAAAAADALLDAGVLADVDPLAFAHPVVRASLHDHLPAARRARLHAAAARQLAADRVDRERIAAHLLRALPGGDPDAVERLRAAAAQARARAAPESAIRYLERALAEPPADWQRPETLLELGRAQAAVGLPAAAETLASALELLRAPARRAEALLWTGRVRFASGALREAAEAFDQGLAELGADGDAAASVELATELRAGFISAARFETSLRPEAQRRLAPLLDTLADGRTRGERALLAEVALERGIRGAPPAEAVTLAMRAWADGAVLEELDAQGIVLSQIAATLTWSDAFDESERVLDAAVAHAERYGAAHQLATAAYLRAWPHYYRGRLARADADARRALDTDGWKMYEPSARAVVALVALERGDASTAADALDVPDAAERWAGSIPYALLLEAAGRLLLTRGDAAAALDAFERCGALIATMDTGHPFCPWRSQAALALDRLGEHERARALAAEEVALARAAQLARPLGGALRVAGLVAGERDAALALLRESAAVLAPSPARLEAARTLLELGAALRDEDPAAAREPLREAIAIAHELGATVLEERARAQLVAAGARPRRVADAGVAALTPTERRIARLAAMGLTNRQIGDEAVVVPKTVQFHLTNVYRKLGIAGRAELARALAQDVSRSAG